MHTMWYTKVYHNFEVFTLRNFTFFLEIHKLCAIPSDAINQLIGARNGDAALLFLYLVRSGGVLDEQKVREMLGLEGGRLESAVACLLRTGCIKELAGKEMPAAKAVLPEVTEPVYTQEELRRGIREDAVFKWLCSAAEHQLGRVLKQYELESLYSIYDFLGMPAEVIVMLIGYLVSARQERIDRGQTVQPVSFRQISREANTWCTGGIDTAEKADQYIKHLQQRRSLLGQALYAIGIRDRTASPGEMKYLNAWLDAGAAVDLIARAYDLTVLQKGSLNWPYMRSIMERWLSRGYRTAADAEAGDQKPSGTRTDTSAQTAFDSDYAARIRAHKERARQENA